MSSCFSRPSTIGAITVCSLLLAVATRIMIVEGSLDGLFLVGNSDTSSVLLLDTNSGKHSFFIRSGTHLIHSDAMMYHPHTGHLLVSSGSKLSNSAILKFDGRTGAYLGRFDDGNGPLHRPYGMTASPDGKWLMVSSFLNNKVLRFWLSSGAFDGELVASPLLNGPNALLFAQDGLLYLTTEGAKYEHGNLTFPYKSQILRLSRDGNEWEVFADDAARYTSPNSALSPNFLGLAISNKPPCGSISTIDYSNGIMAFEMDSNRICSSSATPSLCTPMFPI